MIILVFPLSFSFFSNFTVSPERFEYTLSIISCSGSNEATVYQTFIDIFFSMALSYFGKLDPFYWYFERLSDQTVDIVTMI